MALLKLESAGRREGERWIVREVSFQQDTGMRLAIAGATGSGKSTLLKMIAGLLETHEGKIMISGKRVPGPQEQLIPGHPEIAYLSQHFELRNHYTVLELLNMKSNDNPKYRDRIAALCRIDHLLERKSTALSGGERQRIALALLLLTKPALLLLDEPYSNLDAFHTNILKKVIDDLSEELRITCLVVSHEARDMLSWSQQILILQDGRITARGTPQEIYLHPPDEYTAALFGSYVRLDGIALEYFRRCYPETSNTNIYRPEQFALSEEETGLEGIVKECLYLGSHYEIRVKVMDAEVPVRNGEEVEVGRKCFVMLIR